MAFKVVGGKAPPPRRAVPSGRFPPGLGASGAPAVPKMGGSRPTRTIAMRREPSADEGVDLAVSVAPRPAAGIVPSISRVRVVPPGERSAPPRLFVPAVAALSTSLERIELAVRARTDLDPETLERCAELAGVIAGMRERFAELAEGLVLLEPLAGFDLRPASEVSAVLAELVHGFSDGDAEPAGDDAPPETPRDPSV